MWVLLDTIAASFQSLSEPLTRKGTVFAWNTERQDALYALKSCLLRALILGFPTEADRFVLDTDAVGGVLNQIHDDRQVVIAYASQSLRQSQLRYCTTHRQMLATVTMCNHFCSYLRGAQFTLLTDHRSLQWLQKFRNSDGMLVRWYMLLGQFSVTFEYRPGLSTPMLMASLVGMASVSGWFFVRWDRQTSSTSRPVLRGGTTFHRVGTGRFNGYISASKVVR